MLRNTSLYDTLIEIFKRRNFIYLCIFFLILRIFALRTIYSIISIICALLKDNMRENFDVPKSNTLF